MILMMFLSLVWAPLSGNANTHSIKNKAFHKQNNKELSGYLGSFAIEETEEEEFSEEDNFCFQAAFNFLSSFTSLLQNQTQQFNSPQSKYEICSNSKLFIQIRCILI